MAAPADVIPRRPRLLLILVLAILFVLMSLSTRTRYVGETRTLFERTVMMVFSPVPKLVNWIGGTGSDMNHGYLHMRRSAAANAARHHKAPDLPAENLKLRQTDSDLRRLRALLGYSEQFQLQTTMAEAI